MLACDVFSDKVELERHKIPYVAWAVGVAESAVEASRAG